MSEKFDDHAESVAALALAEQIRPLLAGKGPRIQGAALAMLFATYLAGHAPHARMPVYNALMETTLRLLDDMVNP